MNEVGSVDDRNKRVDVVEVCLDEGISVVVAVRAMKIKSRRGREVEDVLTSGAGEVSQKRLSWQDTRCQCRLNGLGWPIGRSER